MEWIACGIDPGLVTTGYAVMAESGDGVRVLDAGVCRPDPKAVLAHRLAQLESDIAAILEEHRPTVIGVEKLYAHYDHPRTAVMMGHARGVILSTAGRMGIDVVGVGATHVKKFLTGNGHASKRSVQRAIQITLGLTAPPEPPDVADAMAIALCCVADRARHALEGSIE